MFGYWLYQIISLSFPSEEEPQRRTDTTYFIFLPNFKVVMEEFEEMAHNIGSTPKDYEDSLGEMTCNVASRLLLGVKLDYHQVFV